MPTARRSGSLVMTALRTNFASPRRKTSPIFRSSRASSVSSAAAPKTPSFSSSAAAGGIGGSSTAEPIRGHDGPTALISTSAASPGIRAIARIEAIVDSEPWRSRKACSCGVRRRLISENAASPPRMTRPCRPRPSSSAFARLCTPTIAATPRAMQSRKIQRPASPPRRSRSANRPMGQRSCVLRIAAGAFMPTWEQERRLR